MVEDLTGGSKDANGYAYKQQHQSTTTMRNEDHQTVSTLEIPEVSLSMQKESNSQLDVNYDKNLDQITEVASRRSPDK